jgi:eukaryotic-like serine/threonine-protein kinase
VGRTGSPRPHRIMTVTPIPRTGWSYAPGDAMFRGLLAWQCLGGGRRCETWIAWSTSRWMPVVVKLPRPELVDDADTRADLAHEAEVTGTVAHPGAQRLYEACVGADVPHLLFEYVEGPTLSASIAADGPLDPVETVLLGMQLAGALRYLHGRDVVHCDLKPSNVCLREGRPVLIDFGIARRTGEPRRSGAPRGSAPYMAPEQCRDEPAAPAVDMFALGALLYEAASGTRAFHPCRTGDEWRYPQLAGVAPRSLPGELGAVVARLLDPDPAARRDATHAIWSLAAALPPGADRLWPAWLRPEHMS